MEWLGNIWFWIDVVGWAGFLDIALIGLLVYSLLTVFKRTRHSAFAVTGILILAGVYLTALKAGMLVTAWLLQGFFAVVVIMLVVIFQQELRHFFEQIAMWSLRPPWRDGRQPVRSHSREVEVLARTLTDFAKAKIGALVILRGRDMIARHLEGGEELQGRLSEGILKSIFDPNSMGHDGAVIIEKDRIDRFGVHLPLSKNLDQLHGRGTRHTAALGMSELSDALCLVVSEERGEISAARHGELRRVDEAGGLARMIEEFYEQLSPTSNDRPWLNFFRRNYREKILAFLIAAAMWWAVGYQPVQTTREFTLPVQIREVAADLKAVETEPSEVRVKVSGTHVFLKFLSADSLRLELAMGDYEAGAHVVNITPDDLRVPGELEVKDIQPGAVRVTLMAEEPPKEKNP